MPKEIINNSFTSFIQLKPSHAEFTFIEANGDSSEFYKGELERFMLSTDFELINYSINMRSPGAQKIAAQLISIPIMYRGVVFEYSDINIISLYLMDETFTEDGDLEFKDTHYRIKLDELAMERFIKSINDKRFKDLIITIFLDDAAIEQTYGAWEAQNFNAPLLITNFSISILN